MRWLALWWWDLLLRKVIRGPTIPGRGLLVGVHATIVASFARRRYRMFIPTRVRSAAYTAEISSPTFFVIPPRSLLKMLKTLPTMPYRRPMAS